MLQYCRTNLYYKIGDKMANTRPDIVIPSGIWVDLYNASGIPVGTAVELFNKGSMGCCVATSFSAPATTVGIPFHSNSGTIQIAESESGLWVYCPGSVGTRIIIRESVPVPSNLPDNELIVTQYRAVGSGVGYSIGDVVQQVDVFNVLQMPPTCISTIWRNVTAETVISVPIGSDMSAMGAGASTVNANAGTNLNTSQLALEAGGNLASINSKIPATPSTAANQVSGNASLSTLATNSPSLVNGRLPVDGSQVVQPASVSSLPLPTGASTAANQSTANTSLASLVANSPALINGKVPTDGSSVTQPISVVTLPLPTGASTSALQTNANTSLSTLATNSPALVGGKVPVDGSGATQPISASALPLPSGASTSANQATQNTSLSTLVTNSAVLISGRVPVDGSTVVQPVSVTSLPLPSGAATAANQVTMQTSLTAIAAGSPSQYPSSATPVTASSGNVANAVCSATLPAVTGKTNYISGFEMTASGATLGSAVTLTVTGTISGTLSYTFVAPTGILLLSTPLIVQFNPPIPASSTNRAIVVSCPALGTGNTNATAVAHGYTL